MGRCINHPARETSYLCMKHNKYLCEECIKCPDPEIHCKFRTTCLIWFMDKRGGKHIDDTPEKNGTIRVNIIFQTDNKEVGVDKGGMNDGAGTTD